MKTRILFIKYHEAADQQPLSKKAAEKLGIFPSLPLLSLAAWVRENGFQVDYIDLHARNLLTPEALRHNVECIKGQLSAFLDFDHPTHGPMEVVDNPLNLSRTPPTVRLPAPEFGQHTEEVLLEAGLSWDDIIALKDKEVIA